MAGGSPEDPAVEIMDLPLKLVLPPRTATGGSGL
jgi:hypothetical protein